MTSILLYCQAMDYYLLFYSKGRQTWTYQGKICWALHCFMHNSFTSHSVTVWVWCIM